MRQELKKHGYHILVVMNQVVKQTTIESCTTTCSNDASYTSCSGSFFGILVVTMQECTLRLVVTLATGNIVAVTSYQEDRGKIIPATSTSVTRLHPTT